MMKIKTKRMREPYAEMGYIVYLMADDVKVEAYIENTLSGKKARITTLKEKLK